VGEQKVMAGIELVGLGEAEVAAEQVGERVLGQCGAAMRRSYGRNSNGL
jgi:hypothetical protein